MRASSTCCEITSTSCAKGCASTPKSRLNDRTRCGYRANGEKVTAATEAASKLLTQPREVRRHGRHSVAPGCKFRDYRLWSRRAGSMNRDGSRQRRTPMKWMLTMLSAGTCAGAFIALAAPGPAADMSLTPPDCGTPQAPVPVNQRFSDIYAYGDLKLQFVYSCYLIKHGDDYLLWDTGHAMTTPNVAPKVSIVDQLEKIGVKVDQIKYVGISHY